MSELKASDLTAEERAWADAVAVALCSSGNYSAAGAINEAVTLGVPERRALFSPAQPEPKREEVCCPNCLEPVGLDEHAHYQGYGARGWYTCKTAPPPAPVAGELAEEVSEALRVMRIFKSGFYNREADALEFWARSQATAQPVAVGMTPELEFVLKRADFAVLQDRDDDRVDEAYADELEKMIVAVRAQAASAKPKAVPVEAIPVGIWQLEDLLKYADLAEVALRTGFHPPEFLFTPADRSLRQSIDAVKEQRDRWLAAVEGGGS